MPRCECKAAGELLHLDTKKREHFAQPGHRLTGERNRYMPRISRQALHVVTDDPSRVGFRRGQPNKTAQSACSHLLAALPDDCGLGVKIARAMTDNGAAYRSRFFARRLRHLKIKYLRTQPYTPCPHGKAGRFIQTLLHECADAYRHSL